MNVDWHAAVVGPLGLGGDDAKIKTKQQQKYNQFRFESRGIQGDLWLHLVIQIHDILTCSSPCKGNTHTEREIVGSIMIW